jgi:hypothetical protein
MVTMALLLVGALACDGGTNEKEKEKAQKLYDGLADQYCEYVFKCCDTGEVKVVASKRYTDKAGCKSYMKLDYLLQNYTLQLAAGNGAVEIDEGKVDACLSAWKALRCDTPWSYFKVPDACDYRNYLIGQRQGGEGCEAVYECVSGYNCVKAYSSASSGICIPFRKQGEPCSSSSTSVAACDEGLVCANPKDGVRTCKPPAKAGQSCLEIACDPDDRELFCDYSTDPQNPVCTKKKGVGEACKSSTYCRVGLFCDMYTDPANPKCAEPAGQGQACKTSSQCKSDHWCDTYTDPMNPTCQPKKDEGQPCTTGSQCKSLSCDYTTQTCKAGTGTTGSAVCDGK